MKRLTILFKTASPFVVYDNDDRPSDEYSREISTLLASNSISILHLSSNSVIIRPDEISSIVVEEDTSIDENQDSVEPPKPVEVTEHEDIITD